MSKKSTYVQRVAAVFVPLATFIALIFTPVRAYAATIEELQEQIAQYNEDYTAANNRVEELNGLIKDSEHRIAEIEDMLPEQRTRAAESIRTLYRMHQDTPGLVDLVLSSETFFQFIRTLQYLDIIQARNTQEVVELLDLTDELEQTKQELGDQLTEAEEQRQAAQDALDEAVATREALEREAAEEAARLAEERERYLQQAATESGQSFQTSSGQTATVEVPTIVEPQAPSSNDSSSEQPQQQQQDTPAPEPEPEPTPEPEPEPEPTPEPEPEPAPAMNSRDQFVSVWTTRINNYLAGSVLSGYGYAFAEAAWDYGVDPRWSPAISCIESGKGAACYRPHNAWGWGGVSWPDWDTAIRSHVRGLANGYGYTITPAGAAMYCPPGPAWYSAVLNQMYVVWPTDSL